MKSLTQTCLLAAALALFADGAAFAQTAGQDMKNAGQDVKQGAKDTGRGVKRATKTTAKKVKNGTRKGVNKGAEKTGDAARTVQRKTSQ